MGTKHLSKWEEYGTLFITMVSFLKTTITPTPLLHSHSYNKAFTGFALVRQRIFCD
jgi:hypothetical protein